jgi:hypothetical protein
MTGRSKAGGKSAKRANRKTPKPKRRVGSPAVARTSAKGKVDDVQQLIDERDEALEQQTATTEVLKLISSSPDDLQAVFTTILKNAVRICDAVFGELYRWDGEAFQLASMYDTPRLFLEERKSAQLIRPRPNSITGRMSPMLRSNLGI